MTARLNCTYVNDGQPCSDASDSQACSNVNVGQAFCTHTSGGQACSDVNDDQACLYSCQWQPHAILTLGIFVLGCSLVDALFAQDNVYLYY